MSSSGAARQRCAGPAPHRRRRDRGSSSHTPADRRAALAGHRDRGLPARWRAPTPATCWRRAALSRPAARSRASTVEGRRCASCHSHGTTNAGHAVFCAGAWADRLAVAAGADPDPRIVPFRGAYLRLVPERRQLVRSLIYPVPDPSLPFLGVHLTRHIDGEVLIGPTALIAGARDAYRLGHGASPGSARHARPGRARGGCSLRWWTHRRDRAASRGAALGVRARRRSLRARAAGGRRSSPRSPACAHRRSPATAGSSTTSSSPTPSARCTCATPLRLPPPHRSRSPDTWPTRRSGRSAAPERPFAVSHTHL